MLKRKFSQEIFLIVIAKDLNMEQNLEVTKFSTFESKLIRPKDQMLSKLVESDKLKDN